MDEFSNVSWLCFSPSHVFFSVETNLISLSAWDRLFKPATSKLEPRGQIQPAISFCVAYELIVFSFLSGRQKQ